MLHEKMLAVMEDVQKHAVEREELIRYIAIALLTGKNLFILGDTGQAKSYVIDQFRRRITGARQFKRLLTKETNEEQLFGRPDLASLIPGNVSDFELEGNEAYAGLSRKLDGLREQYEADMENGQVHKQMLDTLKRMQDLRSVLAELYGGRPHVNTGGKIPESEIVFLDEIFKASDGILNSLLTALNEREYVNEGALTKIPTISFFAASNEIPNFSDPMEKGLRPLYDRFEMKIVTQYVRERENRLRLLAGKQQSAGGQPVCIHLDELRQMQEEVKRVQVPAQINELMDNILIELRYYKNMHISDRKYFEYTSLVQAEAWLCGRDVVESRDLLTLKCYLWTVPDEIEQVAQVLDLLAANPILERMKLIRQNALEAYEQYMATCTDSPSGAIKAFHEAYLKLYRRIMELQAATADTPMQDQVAAELDQMENLNKQAHQAGGFTYMPLSEFEALYGSAV